MNFLFHIASTIPQILIFVMIFWVKNPIGLMRLGENGVILELSVTWGVCRKLALVVFAREGSTVVAEIDDAMMQEAV